MPYKSDKQRRFMHAQHPKIAAKWDAEGKGHVAKGVKVTDDDVAKGMLRQSVQPKLARRRPVSTFRAVKTGDTNQTKIIGKGFGFKDGSNSAKSALEAYKKNRKPASARRQAEALLDWQVKYPERYPKKIQKADEVSEIVGKAFNPMGFLRRTKASAQSGIAQGMGRATGVSSPASQFQRGVLGGSKYAAQYRKPLGYGAAAGGTAVGGFSLMNKAASKTDYAAARQMLLRAKQPHGKVLNPTEPSRHAYRTGRAEGAGELMVGAHGEDRWVRDGREVGRKMKRLRERGVSKRQGDSEDARYARLGAGAAASGIAGLGAGAYALREGRDATRVARRGAAFAPHAGNVRTIRIEDPKNPKAKTVNARLLDGRAVDVSNRLGKKGLAITGRGAIAGGLSLAGLGGAEKLRRMASERRWN